MADIDLNLESAFPGVPNTRDVSAPEPGDRALNRADPHSSSDDADDFIEFSVNYDDADDVFDLTGGGDQWPESASNPSTGEKSAEENKTLEEFQRLFEDTVKPSHPLNEARGAVQDLTAGAGIEMLEEKEISVPEQDSARQGSAAGEATDGGPEEELEVKLNLAKAYMELGDVDGARSVLNEVTLDGTESQKKEAQQLLNEL
jgi:pilus assembly protein FimV